MSPRTMATVLVVAWFGLLAAAASARHGTDAAISHLYRRAWAGQWQDDVSFNTATLTFGHRKGSFDSRVHINFVGDPLLQQLRDDVGIPDDNGFLVPFMLNAFLRAGLARPDLAPINDTAFDLAVRSTLASVDPFITPRAPVFGFWPWTKRPSGEVRQYAINMNPLMENGIIITDIIDALIKKSSPWAIIRNLADLLKSILEQFTVVFNIPADADDTGVNVGMAYVYEQHAALLPRTVQTWTAQGFNYSRAAEELMRFTYCPASSNASRSSIDPRSYFWARAFLDTLKHPDECIITTWLQSFDQEVATYKAGGKGYLMPFNTNNIDPTVATNALFGLNTILLRNETAWFTQSAAAAKAYLTTFRFLNWTLTNQPLIDRPDLETLYYPSVFDMLAFTGRHLRLLRAHEASGKPWPIAEMGTVLSALSAAMVKGGVPYIASLSTAACGDELPNVTCWDGFLGASDQDWNGTSAPVPLDRYFTTASAANALLASFALDVRPGEITLVPETPSVVKTLLAGAIRYLTEASLSNKTSYMGAFFSGSIHAFNTLPMFFPANVLLLMNDTSVVGNCSATNIPFGDNTFQAVRGQISDDEYTRLLKAGCAGQASRTAFTGMNDPMSPWPFWTSEALVHALALTAIAEYSVVTNPV